jgi:hypothetical protein
MTKHTYLVTASSIALLAAIATASVAQSPGGAGQSGTQEQQKTKPGEGDSKQERGTTEQPKGKGGSAQREADPAPKASDRAEEKSAPKSRVQGQDSTPKASERAQEKASPKSAVQGQKKDGDDDRRSRAADDKGKDATKQQSDKGQGKDRDRSAGDATQDKDRDRSAGDATKDKGGDRSAGDATKDKGRDRSAGDSTKDKDRDRAAGDTTKDKRGDRDRKDRADGDRQKGDRTEGDRGRVQLSEQKRTSVRERISKSAGANRVTKVNFDIRVGASVPRNATLHVLPPDVVEIVPEYRGYRYVYVGEQIAIIDPNDYVVVAVIGGDSRVGSRSGGRITLASDDRVFVRRHVDLGARVRLGIGAISIGMNLPETVELRPLPDVVVQRYPDLRGHRYIVYEEDVVIVEPQSREVILVLEN